MGAGALANRNVDCVNAMLDELTLTATDATLFVSIADAAVKRRLHALYITFVNSIANLMTKRNQGLGFRNQGLGFRN